MHHVIAGWGRRWQDKGGPPEVKNPAHAESPAGQYTEFNCSVAGEEKMGFLVRIFITVCNMHREREQIIRNVNAFLCSALKWN